MANRLWDRLRGARHIELYVAVAVMAVLALLVLRGGARAPAPSKTTLEQRLERILSQIHGAGAVSAMISEDVDGKTVGVVVVADGLQDVKTYLQLQRAVQTATGIDTSRIAIIGNDGAFEGGS